MDENTNSEQGTARLRPREQTRQRWRTLLAEQHDSGLEVAEFCRQRSIASSSFYCWRRKLAGPQHQAKGGFVPLRLAAGSRQFRHGGSTLEIRLRGGRRLLVRDPFDRDLLVELIGVLEGLA